MCCDGERETTIWFQSLETGDCSSEVGTSAVIRQLGVGWGQSWENELAWNEEKVPALITGTSGHALPGISSPLIIF